MHYLVHYPEQLKEFGPLVNCWTLRFESKHSYFKDVTYRLKNKKNICKTLAVRHEFYQAMFRSRPNFLEGEKLNSSGGSMIQISLLLKEVQELVKPLTKISSIFQTKVINIDGVTYCVGSAVMIQNLQSDFCIQFAVIESFFLVGGATFILAKPYRVLEYITHLHAYNIMESEGLCVLKTEDLAHYHSLGAYDWEPGKLVVLKHHIGFC